MEDKIVGSWIEKNGRIVGDEASKRVRKAYQPVREARHDRRRLGEAHEKYGAVVPETSTPV
jgi:hypothetical protein